MRGAVRLMLTKTPGLIYQFLLKPSPTQAIFSQKAPKSQKSFYINYTLSYKAWGGK